MDTPSVPLKQCSRKEKCIHPEANAGWLPATKDYFPPRKTSKDGFTGQCRVCVKARNDHWADNNKEYLADYHRNYRDTNREQIRAKGRAYNVEHREQRNLYAAQYRAEHRQEINSRIHRYQIEHRELTRKACRQWYQANRSNRALYRKTRRLNDRARVLQVHHASTLRRRARQRSLPAQFTTSDWQRCLDYFHYCCAVCGRQLNDLFGTHKASADHWIPLASPDCIGTVPQNTLPLCHGLNGCNNRKQDRDPLEFLETEFGKRRAAELLSRIEAYFKWISDQG